jgi:hypothetical protein
MGPYPMFVCKDWRALAADLDDLRKDLVCVAVVTDPLGAHDRALIEDTFDFVNDFKDHFITQLGAPPQEYVRKRYRQTAQRALENLTVERATEPLELLDDWERLYGVLIRRHEIKGVRAFSRKAFEFQLSLPGCCLFQVRAGGEVIGLDWWFVAGPFAYAHLAAFSESAYDNDASYAALWKILHEFTDTGLQFANFGGSAGVKADVHDGLAVFKKGWTNMAKPAWFCGTIFQPDTYETLLRERGLTPGGYFPKYREGEYA